MDKVSDLLPKFLSEKRLASVANASSVLNEFDKICREKFGERVMSAVKGKFVKKEVLYAAVKDVAWGQKIHFCSEEVIEKIEKKLSVRIKKIRTKVESIE